MRPISFNKTIVFKEVIQSIEDVYIEDHLDYLMKDHDLECTGKIDLRFSADNGREKQVINDTVSVDCVLNLSKIDCQKDLRLQFKDYQVQLDERILRFIFRYELLGNGEKILSFQEVGDEEVEEKVLRALNRDFTSEKNDETINMIKNLLTNEDIDIIGAEDLLPVLAKNTEDLDLDEIEIDDKPIEPVVILPNEEKVEPSIAEKETDDIKLNEKYVISFFFYKVTSDDETYEGLAKEFNIDPSAIRLSNKDEPLYKGKLVKLVK